MEVADRKDGPSTPPPPSLPGSPQVRVARARLLVRTGAIRLSTASIDSALDAAEELAVRLGGYTDRREPQMVVLRIPVAHFDEAFQSVQLLGRVLDHSQGAQDVTDEFQDLGLQVRIQRQLLRKLQELLAIETDYQRRKLLIQEIQTASETVERLERRQARLANEAAFSTLTLACEAPKRRGSGLTENDLAVFSWIGELQARSTDDRSPRGKRLPLAVPKGMVELPKRDSRDEWMASSPEGAEFRSRTLPNQPVGDNLFWREALRLRLGPGFRTFDTFDVGRWRVLRLVSAEPCAWVWWLAVDTNGDELHLAQGFYPDSALERRERPALEQALRQEAP